MLLVLVLCVLLLSVSGLLVQVVTCCGCWWCCPVVVGAGVEGAGAVCLVCAVALLVLVLSVLLLGVVGAGVVCLVVGAAALLVLVLCVLSLVLVGTGVVGTGDVCGAVVVVGCATVGWSARSSRGVPRERGRIRRKTLWRKNKAAPCSDDMSSSTTKQRCPFGHAASGRRKAGASRSCRSFGRTSPTPSGRSSGTP